MKKLLSIVLTACLIITAYPLSLFEVEASSVFGYNYNSSGEIIIADYYGDGGDVIIPEKIGAPQVKTIHGNTVWVYFGADENYRGPLAPTYTDETVLLAWVNGKRVVKTAVLRDADLPDVVIAEGETEIPAAIELNAIQELFNNIGRFSPAGLGQ